MSKLVIRGRCHPPPTTDPAYKGWKLKSSEIDRVMPKFVNKPVYIEHDKSKGAVGRVHAVYRDKESGSIVVDLSLNHDNLGWDAMKRVQSGELGELSISYDASGNEHYARTSEAIPQEISLVKKGAMHDAMIFAIRVDDHVALSSQHKRSAYAPSRTKMSQSEETSAPVPTDVDPLAKYSKDQIARMVKLAEETETRKLNELKESLVKSLAPAYEKFVLEDGANEDRAFGPAVQKILATEEGRTVLNIAAKLSGNFLKFEKLYYEKLEEIKKIQEEKTKFESSKVALQTEDERKSFLDVSPMFAVANSAEGEEEPAYKRMRIADLFSMENKSSMDSIRNGLISGQIFSPPVNKST